MATKLQARRAAALKMPTDPPKPKPAPPFDPTPQRTYNVKRREAEQAFYEWWMKTEKEKPLGLEGLVELGKKKNDAEYHYEVAKSEYDRAQELHNRYLTQERAWLAAQKIEESWTATKTSTSKV